jgi:hypothetical protein
MAKEKVMGQSTRKPLRFTAMHKKLTEGLKDLIRLYYLFKNNEPFIPVMKDFLKRITGEDFEYKRETESLIKKLITEGEIPKGNYFISRRHLIHFNDDQKGWFVKIMDLLHESIMERTVDHFYAVKWVHKTETHMEEGELKILAPDVIIEEGFKVNRSIPERLIHKQAIETLQKQQPQIQEYSLSGKGWKQVDGSKKRVKVISVPYRVYEVRSGTEFGGTLLWTESIINHLEYPISDYDPLHHRGGNYREVPSINFFVGRGYFLQIVRSLLVDYHIVFGNFEYIKVCEWCKNLFVEKRKGRGRFCSKDCQRKSMQSSEKYKCMNRQNMWIGRQIAKIKKQVDIFRFKLTDIPKYKPGPGHVSPDDCETCNTCVKGGKCNALMEMNKKVLSIQKELPVIQKELLNPLMKGKDVVYKLKRLLRESR